MLGRAFYDAHRDEDVEESIYFGPIEEAEEEIMNLKADLLMAQGAVECPACGAKQAEKNDFCSKCGSSLKEAEDDIVADFTDEFVRDEDIDDVIFDDSAKG